MEINSRRLLHPRTFPALAIAALLVLLALLHAAPPAAHATPRPQDADDATLRIINDSNQTICDVFIAPATATVWGDNWLDGEESIPPEKEHAFALTIGDYHILLADCEGNQLLDQRNTTVSGLYELRFTGPDLCKPLNQEGMALYRQAMYRDARAVQF